MAGGCRFRCAGTVVPECAATGDMRLTLSLGVEHAGRAEGGIGLVGVGGPGKSHALGLGLLGLLGSLGGRSQAGLCDAGVDD